MDVIPAKLDLKKTQSLSITWSDGETSVYTLEYLRSMCPCATCKEVRLANVPAAHRNDPPSAQRPAPDAGKKRSLTILPGNYSDGLSVVDAQLVGNYALQIDWSDQHGSGIYSFQYLREIRPAAR
jgi:DUF971 family protein